MTKSKVKLIEACFTLLLVCGASGGGDSDTSGEPSVYNVTVNQTLTHHGHENKDPEVNLNIGLSFDITETDRGTEDGDELATTFSSVEEVATTVIPGGSDGALHHEPIKVFKCFNSSMTSKAQAFQVPIWLRQFISDDKYDKLAEEFGAQFYNFPFAEAPLSCGSSQVAFFLGKNETQDIFSQLRGKNSMHSVNTKMNGFFLHNGYLKYNIDSVNYYYPPGSYCLSSITNDYVEGHLCPEVNGKVIPQIRKCTAMGFLLLMEPNTGLPFEIKEVDDRDWSPLFYKTDNPKKPGEEIILPIFTQSRPKDCLRTILVTNPDILRVESKIFYRSVRFLEDGTKLGRLRGSDPWKDLDGPLKFLSSCVDGYIDFNDNEFKNNTIYYLKQDRQIIIGCLKNTTDSTGGFTIVDMYAYIAFVPTLVLLLILIIYALVWPKQNIHGRTSAAFVFCMFIYFCTLIVSNVKVMSFGSPHCVVNGAIQHYFYLSMYYWMAVMNFDVWNTIRSMVAVSQRGKGTKRFLLYCGIAFGIPTIVVTISLILHNSYTVDEENVILPLYGYYQCSVDKTVQLYYYLCPVGFVFVTSIVFGLMTMYTLYKLKKDTKRIETSNTKSSQKQYELSVIRNRLNSQFAMQRPSSSARGRGPEEGRRRRTNSKLYANYRWHVIVKLFLLTGISWFSDLVYSITTPDATWYWLIIDAYNFCQAFFLFSIFICKKEIYNQLTQYQVIKRAFEWWDAKVAKVPYIGSKIPVTKSTAMDSSTYSTVQSEVVSTTSVK